MILLHKLDTYLPLHKQKEDLKLCACGYPKPRGLLLPGNAGRKVQTRADCWGGEGALDLLSKSQRKQKWYSAHNMSGIHCKFNG